MPYVNHKGADQTTHPRNTFVSLCLDSIISRDSTAEIFCGCAGRFSRNEARIWVAGLVFQWQLILRFPC